jgi:hypothetical protein
MRLEAWRNGSPDWDGELLPGLLQMTDENFRDNILAEHGRVLDLLRDAGKTPEEWLHVINEAAQVTRRRLWCFLQCSQILGETHCDGKY